MEFKYCAGDDRISPPATGTAAAASTSSGCAGEIATAVAAVPSDGHRGGATGDHVENRAVVPRPPPPDDSDEVQRRQAAKDKIRERILREEAEHWALEAEVRRELMEQLLPLLRPGLTRPAGGSADGSDGVAAPAGTTTTAADSPSPSVLEITPWQITEGNVPLQSGFGRLAGPRAEALNIVAAPAGMMTTGSPSPIVLEASSKANASATLPVKRKNLYDTAGSAIWAASSRKKQKPTNLVCSTKATSMKGMQDHLMGRGLYTPTKFMMLTNTGAMNEVLQMDGYLFCKVCNVRTTDRVTMMYHLEGNHHILKAQKQRQPRKPLELGTVAAAKDMKWGSTQAITTTVTTGDLETTIMMVYGVPCIVRRADGFVLCKCCDVKASSESDTQSHLAGKKYKNKVKVSLEQGKAKDVACVASAMPQAKADDTSVSVDVKLADGKMKIGALTTVAGKVGDRYKLQEMEKLMRREVVTNVDETSSAPRQEVKKVHAPAVSITSSCFQTVVTDIDNIQHVDQLMDGIVCCECCNLKMLSDRDMRSHLTGKKHKKNAKTATAGNVGAGWKEAVVLSQANSNEVVPAVPVTGSCFQTVVIDIDNVQHAVQLMDGVLCECCNVKTPSEHAMRFHLTGKKHKKNAKTVTAGNVGAGGKEAVVLSQAKSNEAARAVAGMGQTLQNDSLNRQATGEVELKLTMAQEEVAGAGISTAPMEVIEPAKIKDDSSTADQEEGVDSKVHDTRRGTHQDRCHPAAWPRGEDPGGGQDVHSACSMKMARSRADSAAFIAATRTASCSSSTPGRIGTRSLSQRSGRWPPCLQWQSWRRRGMTEGRPPRERLLR